MTRTDRQFDLGFTTYPIVPDSDLSDRANQIVEMFWPEQFAPAIHRLSVQRAHRDPFGGSGTTLIACEKSGRRARLMELDPKYVDVIVKRWQLFSGKQAVRQADQLKFDEISPAPPTLTVAEKPL